jgi:Na+-transporting NADH:ubiquinone oxidoreductase subunit NqrE
VCGTDSIYRERQDAIPIFLAVCAVSGLVLSANTLIRQRGRRYLELMLYDFRTKSGRWKRILASIPKRMEFPKIPKILYGLEDWSGSMKMMRLHASWALQVVLL